MENKISYEPSPSSIMAAVQILGTSKILPNSNSFSIRNDTTVPLSFLDSGWVSIPPIRRLFLYPPSDHLQFYSFVKSLKSSLASILPFFHVLAGKLAYDPSSKSVFIDCSKDAVGDGVSFMEAESETLDFDLLTRDEVHDLDAFSRFVPHFTDLELPMPVFAVQVTTFSNGGVAVGITINHAVMDGKGLWQFVHAWANNCKSGDAVLPSKMAAHDRSVIRFEPAEEAAKKLLTRMMPNLPKINPDQPNEHFPYNPNIWSRTFTINKVSIQILKQILLFQDPTRASPPSSFTSLIAHTWISLTRARANTYGPKYSTSHLLISIDVRAYLNPPIDQSYTGNCIVVGFIHMPFTELLGPTGFVRACSSIEKVVMVTRRDPLLRILEYDKEFMSIHPEMMVTVAGSPNFRAYDTDFGWGKPSRVELLTMHEDGKVATAAGREEGTIQISVSALAQFMDPFAKFFLSGLQT